MEEEFLEENQGRGTYFHLAKSIALDRFFGVGLNNWSYWVSLRYGPDMGRQYTPYNGTDEAPDQSVVLGRGIDNRAQAAPAHSIMALTIGELGWPGIVLFAGIWVQWFRMAASFLRQRSPAMVSRYGLGTFVALWGLFLSNVTEFSFRMTPIFFLVHALMGALAPLYDQRRRGDLG